MTTSGKKPLRTGYTTGSCATAATAAALELLFNHTCKSSVKLTLPSGDTAEISIEHTELSGDTATAQVIKFSGDDPDITNGALISSSVKLNQTGEILFFAGKGVGTITREGLQLPVGSPAINPVPREMMSRTARNYTSQGVDITIAVAGGEELANKTFNPRLGIIGGISIIGTSGIVRPFSHAAIQETVRISIDVATATGKTRLILVAGHYGMRAAQHFFNAPTEDIIEVSNEWDTAMQHAAMKKPLSLLLLSHPGKLAKFIDGHFNTHSKCSPSALPIVQRIATELDIPITETENTVEGVFQRLSSTDTTLLGVTLAERIAQSAKQHSKIPNIDVVLIDMQNHILAESGDTSKWRKK